MSSIQKPVIPVTVVPPQTMSAFFDLFTDYNDNAGAILKKPKGLMYDEQQQAWKNKKTYNKNENKKLQVMYDKLLNDTDDTLI